MPARSTTALGSALDITTVTEQNQTPAPVRLIRLPEVMHITGLSRASIYRLSDAGTFPRPRKIGARASAWSSVEIDGWIAARLAA